MAESRSKPIVRPVVAELGRPETPAETAERKAQNSRNYRESKTLKNLLVALVLTVGIVAIIVLLVPRDDSSRLSAVDYRAVATSAARSFPVPLAVPSVPASWSSNVAELRSGTLDDVTSWYVGLITPSKQFLSLTQAVDANPSWLVTELHETTASRVTTIDGIEWTVYDNRKATKDVGNMQYALSTVAGRSTFIIGGTAEPDDAERLASSISETVHEQQNDGATS